MPATSEKQLRLMYAARGGKVKDIPPEVAEEFIRKTPRKKRKALMQGTEPKRNG